MIRFLLASSLVLGASAAYAQAEFAACVAGLRATATKNGVSTESFDASMRGVEFDPTVLEASANQPEFKTPIWDYLAALADDERVSDGRAKLTEWATALATAEQRYGVDRHTIVAVWGVESDYGRSMGARPLVRSLATLACNGVRQTYFRGELFATLKILQAGDVRPEALVGSWAGAFGHTQFMPSTFLRLAVDLDGDGRRDIVESIPDALGSTANFLNRAGWVSGAPWGFEVRVPAGYQGESGRTTKRPLAEWVARGIKRANGDAITGAGDAALLLPAGRNGPAFLVFKNFDAIFTYNRAESYALAIAHVADRMRGAGPFVAPWPTDDRGISRAERREVQQRLTQAGFDVGTPDGRIGPRTQAAIKEFQAKQKMEVIGRAGGKLLDALRAATK
jgi:lytic murein transglycosylase